MNPLIAVAPAALVAVVLIVVLLRRGYLVITVDGRSMEPAYRCGDQVLIRRRSLRRIRTGQVVVGRYPQRSDPYDIPGVPREDIALVLPESRLFVKRVAARPGDPVPRAQVPALRAVSETVVPPGRLVVLGDNSAISYDSREFGYVHADQIIGVLIRRMHAAS
jgi:signal peptidase I